MREGPNESTPLVTTDQSEPSYVDAGNNSETDDEEVERQFSAAMKNSRTSTAHVAFDSMPTSMVEKNKKNNKKKKNKKKKNCILLNFDSAMELEYQVQINLIKHNLASMYFESRQFWFFTITQGILTMLASILAFIASSSLLNEVTKDIIATIVGSTSGIVVFLQTMSGVCNYGTRAAMHASAAIDLRDLRDEIVLIKFKVKKEELDAAQLKQTSRRSFVTTTTSFAMKADDNDESSSDDESNEDTKKAIEEEEKQEQEHDNTFGRIQQRYRQSLSGCKSNVPMDLSEAFHGMHSNLLVSESIDNAIYMRNII